MKITFDLPNWATDKTISIFAGRELLAKKEVTAFFNGKKHVTNPNQPLMIKLLSEYRCNGCGDCCSTGGSPFSREILEEVKKRLKDYEWQGTGTKCPLLADDGCSMKGSIPFSCAKSNCEGWSENCSEKLVEVI